MSIHRKLEIAANVAIVIVALLIVWVAVTKYVFPKPVVEALASGQQMPLSDVDWRTNQRTVVLVLKKGCHLCDDSAEFHQGVLSLAKERGIPVVAALPDEPSEGQAYVTSLALEIPAIKAVSLAKLRILRVPSVILVDRNGMVERVWSGRLSAVQEKDVLRALGEPIVLGYSAPPRGTAGPSQAGFSLGRRDPGPRRRAFGPPAEQEEGSSGFRDLRLAFNSAGRPPLESERRRWRPCG